MTPWIAVMVLAFATLGTTAIRALRARRRHVRPYYKLSSYQRTDGEAA